MNKPVVVIANSEAGRAYRTVDQLIGVLDRRGISHQLHEITTPPEAVDVVDSLSKDKISCILTYGGDGTTVAIIKAATRKDVEVLPIRGGTGNGLARSIGIAEDVEANIEAFSTGNYIVRNLPLASVNNEPLVLDFHFGLLAQSVLSTPRGVKKWLGDKAYILNTIKKGATDTKDPYHLRIDGVDVKFDAYACYVANITTMTYFGVNIFPKPKEGYVRVMALRSRSPLKLTWWYLVKRLTGRSFKKAIMHWYGQTIEFHQTPKKMIFDDHERKVRLPLAVEAETQYAKVILPIVKKKGWGRIRSALKTEYYRQTDHVHRIVSGVPSERFSKVSSQLYLGGRYGSKAIQAFAVRGITGIVNMRERVPKEIDKSANIEILHLSTRDHTAPTIQNLQRGVVFMRKHIESGGSVYVHCRMGEGRGPTMAAAYLISTGMGTEQALTHLRQYRPFARPNKKQVKVLKEFEAKIRE